MEASAIGNGDRLDRRNGVRAPGRTPDEQRDFREAPAAQPRALSRAGTRNQKADPQPQSQQLLDAALARADSAVRERFAVLCAEPGTKRRRRCGICSPCGRCKLASRLSTGSPPTRISARPLPGSTISRAGSRVPPAVRWRRGSPSSTGATCSTVPTAAAASGSRLSPSALADYYSEHGRGIRTVRRALPRWRGHDERAYSPGLARSRMPADQRIRPAHLHARRARPCGSTRHHGRRSRGPASRRDTDCGYPVHRIDPVPADQHRHRPGQARRDTRPVTLHLVRAHARPARRRAGRRPGSRRVSPVPGSLPLRDRYLPDVASVLDVSGRLCAGGALALCAFARPATFYRDRADYVCWFRNARAT